MKQYKQAKIPKGSIEVRMRGSSEEESNLSIKLIMKSDIALQALSFMTQYPQVKRKRNI